MPNGYTGQILHVNLTQGTFQIEQPPEDFYRKYMGGSAFGLYYILREVPVGIDPLSSENILTLMLSVMTGAPVSGQSRLNVNAKSPMTDGIGDSQSGGYFPAELKFAGFDGIVVRGRSPSPVYLTIHNGKPELHDASHLMGKVTGEVESILKAELGDPKIQILQCGPGAEAGVRFSTMISMSNRNNGRTGMGLVMASKNLKAIAVRGTQRISTANPKAVTELAKTGAKWLPDNADVDGLGKYGTAVVVMPQNMLGSLPTRNYTEGQFEFCEDISGEKMYDTVLKERETCYACVVRCKRVVEIKDGKYPVDPVYGGPEYETLATFGSYCGIRDLAAICKANEICNMYGVDTISAGATIAFAIECFQRGIIGLEQTGGLQLTYGDPDGMLEVLRQIATHTGALGPILSEGSARAAKVWGPAAEECLVTVKNEEAPAHMPQSKKSLALIYAVNPFGADHQSSEHDWMYEEGCPPLYLERLEKIGLTQPPAPGSFGPEKVKFGAYTQWFYSMLDTLELCQFVYGPAWCLYGPDEIARLVSAVTGWDVTVQELMDVGRRRLNMLRAFNAREGFSRKDDRLPKKFFKPLVGTGPTADVAIDPGEFETALDQYYDLNGWTQGGLPTQNTLTALGLDWISDPAIPVK